MGKINKEIYDKYKEIMKEAESSSYEIMNVLKGQKINVGIAALSGCLLYLKRCDDDISLDEIFTFIRLIEKSTKIHTIN